MTEPAELLNLTDKSFPLDRYEPLSLLGRGGLGEVYLAKDRVLGRTIAVKCLMAVDDEQIVIFQREAKIASKLHHPCIIGTLDFGTTEGGRPFIAFEYFDGISLERLIADHGGVIEESLVRRIFIVVTEALSYIHKHDVFHRDLKPSNVLLKFDNVGHLDLKIIDFGVSAIKEEFQNKDLAQGKTIVGTPVYMSPDPVRGEPFDARSEVYSIGCILFECLTGEPPFDSESTAEVLEKHMTDEPPLLEDVCPDRRFSPEIQEIISKCLLKAKSDRYQSMEELTEALVRPVAGVKPPTIEVAPPLESEKKQIAFGKIVAVIIIVGVLSASGAALVASILSAPTQTDEVSRIMKRHDDLDQSTASLKNRQSHTNRPAVPPGSDQGDAQGIYLSGSDGLKRLAEIAHGGGVKQRVSFTNLKLTLNAVEDLRAINPEVIQIYKCEIPEPVFAKLTTISSVRELLLQQCPHISPAYMTNLRGAENLVSLRLIGCGINDEHLKEIAELKHLKKLVLDGNKDITMDGLLQLKRQSDLIAVWLNEGPVTALKEKEVLDLERKYGIKLWNKLERYEGEGGDGLVSPEALELLK